MRAYYNDNNKYNVRWLRKLISRGIITSGIVDDRDIRDVHPSDLDGFDRVHFFAGVGAWDFAVDLAGWNGPIWTGSCPCQPFSKAGPRAGFADERHLWPAFLHLIRERRPGVVIGEQVESEAGRAWLDLVHDDLEGSEYTSGAVFAPSAGVGAPNIRSRSYWLAERVGYANTARSSLREPSPYTGTAGQSQRRAIEQSGEASHPWQDVEWIDCLDGCRRPIEPRILPLVDWSAYRLDSGSALAGKRRAALIEGYGNAINPWIAAAFLESYIDVLRG